MKSKKLKMIITCLTMAFISLGLITGCGKKENDKKELTPTATSEINGKKVQLAPMK